MWDSSACSSLRSDTLHSQSMNPHGAGIGQGGSWLTFKVCGVWGNATVEAGCWPSHLSRSAHLFLRMRPVEAQEEVGVPAVQEEICSSEGDREALDSAAEVGGDPEVRDKGIHEDILGRKGPARKKESRQSGSSRSERSSG